MLKKPCRVLALALLCSIAQAGASIADGPPFIGRLPWGTVELVGITYYPPTKQSQWWQPDGSAARIGAFRPRKTRHMRVLTDEKVLGFLVRFENMPADASPDPIGGINSSTTPRWVSGSPWWVSGTRSWVAGSGRRLSNPCSDPIDGLWEAVSSVDMDAYGVPIAGKAGSSPSTPTASADTYARGNIAPNYYKMYYTKLDKFSPTTDLRVGVSMGAWETVVSRKPDIAGVSTFSRDGQEWTVSFGKATTSHETAAGDTTQVVLRSTRTWGLWTKRLVAVASDGSEHVTSIGNNVGGDTGTAVFRNLRLSSIKEFRLQVRPYHWIEFKNISLQSGQKTDVTVVSPDDSVETEE